MNEPLTRIIGGKLWRWNPATQGYENPETMDSGPQTPQSEQTLRYEPLATPGIPGCGKRRAILCVSQFTRRRQDPDNSCPKYEIDWLRAEGIISDDTDDDIELQIKQIQVFKEEDEGVLIEIL